MNTMTENKQILKLNYTHTALITRECYQFNVETTRTATAQKIRIS